MGFGSDQTAIWPVPPNWGGGVREQLSWATEIHRAPKSAWSQHIGTRIGPLRSFTFNTLDWGQRKRVADALLHARGARPWLLPIWPDVQYLRAEVATNDEEIACRTAGFDFREGGQALLWRAVNDWEVVTIAAVDPSGLALEAGVAAPWRRGDRLYPLRRARLDGRARIHTITDDAHRTSITMHIDEPSDWPAAMPSLEYLGHPVLGQGPDNGEDGEVHYERLVERIGNPAGLDAEFDTAGIALRGQSHVWELWGRVGQAEFRSLLYALRGRQVPLWVPTWMSDLRPVAPISGGSSLLSVEWAGYTVLGGAQPNRRDLRIELHDGTVFIRRVTGSAEDGDREVLQLSAPLGQAVDPGHVRRISFMGLATLASDTVDWQHETDADGRARVVSAWAEVLPDV